MEEAGKGGGGRGNGGREERGERKMKSGGPSKAELDRADFGNRMGAGDVGCTIATRNLKMTRMSDG